MSLKLITAPTSEPITLAEAKSHCRVDISADDTYIGTLIQAAREWCEAHDWRAYMPQTWELYLDAFPACSMIELPRPPLTSVTSIKYTDSDGVEHTQSSSEYLVDTVSTPGRIVLKTNYTWPSAVLREANGAYIRFVCGYASAADVPQPIKQAMLLLIGHWYENRENSTVGAVNRSIEFGVKALLDVNRAFRF
jgi:uncharacterized phiE125 gp8 family phage protein